MIGTKIYNLAYNLRRHTIERLVSVVVAHAAPLMNNAISSAFAGLLS